MLLKITLVWLLFQIFSFLLIQHIVNFFLSLHRAVKTFRSFFPLFPSPFSIRLFLFLPTFLILLFLQFISISSNYGLCSHCFFYFSVFLFSLSLTPCLYMCSLSQLPSVLAPSVPLEDRYLLLFHAHPSRIIE